MKQAYVQVRLTRNHGSHKKGDLVKVDPLRAKQWRKDKIASIPKDENPPELLEEVK